MRIMILFACACMLASCTGLKPSLESSQERSSAERPNFILIVADDLGYADVGFNGYDRIPTPNLDRLAAEGVRFTQGYVSHPICGPSRAGLLTGRHQGRFGYSINSSVDPSDAAAGIPTSEENIAEVLSKVGYDTHAIGKWHVGTHPSLRPNARGFDSFYGFLSGGHRYFPEDLTIERLEDSEFHGDWYYTKILENETPVETSKYLTHEFTDRAVSIINEADQDPFFIYLAYNAPHAPMQAPEEYLARFPDVENERERTYMAMVSAMDDDVGRIMQTLAETGQADNTVLVFLSDNGGPNGAASNGSLRGYKRDLFEGGVRVPFVVKAPGYDLVGDVYEKPVSSLDILPTFAALAGATAKNELDGVDLLPFITGADVSAPHDFLYWRRFELSEFAILDGNNAKGLWVKEGDFLYDLTADESESNDLSADNAELAKLRVRLEEWRAQLQDPQYNILRTWLPPRPHHDWYIPNWKPGYVPPPKD